MSVSEFDVIDFILQQQRTTRADVIVRAGDDGAVLRLPTGSDLVVSVDTLVAGVHFFPDASPSDVGFKALAVNLSDLAAMGAAPAWFTLALTLPGIDRLWLAAFCQGLFELAEVHNTQLVGGDTTQGELAISIQVHGFVSRGHYLSRTGARSGDLVMTTGWLGGAALALRSLQEGTPLNGVLQAVCSRKLHRPSPRVAAGLALVDIATSAIDISDGLAADLGHILRGSDVGAVLDLGAFPMAPGMDVVVGSESAWEMALGGGDDYELCFTVSPAEVETATHRLNECGVSCTCIGYITADRGLRLLRPDGTCMASEFAGFQHFR